MSQRSVGKLLSHSAEGLHGEPFCISENLSIEKKLKHKGGIRILPKNFMDKKVSRRECHNFTSKNCFLTVPKNSSLGNSFLFQTISCMEKKHEKQVFITIFCPSFSVSRFSRKILGIRCGEGISVATFRRKTFVSQCRRTSWGTILYFREPQHRKKTFA